MTLRWQKGGHGWFVFSHDLCVASVTVLDDGEYLYDCTLAVHMRYIAKGVGQVKTLRACRVAVNRAWETWLAMAGLSPIDEAGK